MVKNKQKPKTQQTKKTTALKSTEEAFCILILKNDTWECDYSDAQDGASPSQLTILLLC